MRDVILIEGPVMKIGDELVLFIETQYPEGVRVVISDRLARASQIEVGDLVCLSSTDSRFELRPVKARSMS